MKNGFSTLAFCLSTAVVTAQTPASVEEQLTSLWKEKNYEAIRTLLDEKSSGNPPDVVALYCSKVFYVFIRPDKAKDLSAANKLKQVAEATGNAGFVGLASLEVADVQGLPDSGFVLRSSKALTWWHTHFPDAYPNVEYGARLRRFKSP
jgi:hypothetical protein